MSYKTLWGIKHDLLLIISEHTLIILLWSTISTAKMWNVIYNKPLLYGNANCFPLTPSSFDKLYHSHYSKYYKKHQSVTVADVFMATKFLGFVPCKHKNDIWPKILIWYQNLEVFSSTDCTWIMYSTTVFTILVEINVKCMIKWPAYFEK